MKQILIGVFGTGLAVIGIAAAILSMGWIDVAADAPHSRAVYRLIEFAREQSIESRIRELMPPPDLASHERIRRGAGNYDAMCLNCHLAPGVSDSEIRRGLYPQPPNLSRAANGSLSANQIAARRFWIIKHGIKASGMPAWSKGGMGDAAIWDLAAFLDVLPTLSQQQYHEYVEASDGHSHAGSEPAHAHGGKGG